MWRWRAIWCGQAVRLVGVGHGVLLAAAEMWEKCGEKLDRRRAGAYIPGINAMAGGAGGCGGAYGARATGHGRRCCSGRNVHGRGSRSDDILDF